MFQILGNPPFFTFFTFVLCCVLRFFGPGLTSACFIPRLLLPGFQIQRMFLAPFFHVGFFHLLFNMFAWLSLVRDFEYTAGSLSTMYAFIILLIPLNSVIHTILAYVIDFIFHSAFAMQCSVGVSGLLFATFVISLQASGNPHASFLGLFSLPALWYPPFLALLLQIFAPNVSFLGHIAGILSGHILSRGSLRMITPSIETFASVESKLRLSRLPAWQTVPSPFGQLLSPGTAPRRPPSLIQQIKNSWRRMMSRGTRAGGGISSQPPHPPSGNVGTAFNPPSPSTSTQPFSGEGFTLGGAAPVDEGPVGRVPATSRLLQLDRSQPSDANDSDSRDNVDLQSMSSPGQPV